MPERTHTIRQGINLMPWKIDPDDGLNQTCILVAVMNGSEMQSVSLHVADRAEKSDEQHL